MANLGSITYSAKTNLNAVVDRPKQATAEDFNEIKSVVNLGIDAINAMKCDEAEVSAGDNTIVFNTAYPDGYEFVIVSVVVTDATGLRLGYRVSNKSKNGFDINVPADGTVVYLTMPRR